ncbi:MAG TPA: PAS domain S-box protein [Syntrophorhabdaceae bacterium]|nr:PAS domain S-box protein [Syntrophorhabdaceae bacterium]
MAEKGRTVGSFDQAAAEARLDSELFEALVGAFCDGFFITDTRGSFLAADPSLCSLLGYSSAEILGMSLYDIDTSKAFEETIIHIQRMIEKDSGRYDTRYRRKDGTLIDVEVGILYRPFPESGGRFFGMVRHIGHQKRIEKALKESEELFKALFERSADAVLIFEKGRCVDCNDKALEVLKCSDRARIIGRALSEMAPVKQANGVDSQERARKMLKMVLADGAGRFMWTVQTMDGAETVFEVSAVNVPFHGGKTALYTVWREKKHPEAPSKEARESEGRFRAFSYASHEALLHLDNQGKIIYSNPAAARIMGYGERETQGMEIHSFLKPLHYHDEQKLQLGIAEAMPVALRSGEAAVSGKALELTVVRKDRSEADIELSLLSEEAGSKWRMIALFRDVTEQKRAVETLRKSEEKYRRLFEETKDVVFLSTPAGELLDINKAGVELFGYPSKEEMLKINLTRDLYRNPEDRDRFSREIERSGSARLDELSLKHRNGGDVIVSVTANAVYDEVGNAVVYQAIMRDLTNVKRLEQQVRAFQKMDAVRELIGDIAHNFNNILNIIIGNAQLARMSADCAGDVPGHLSSIEDEVFRAADMVDRLLASGSRQPVDMRTVDMNRIVRDFEKVIARVVSERISTVVSYTATPVFAKVDAAQMNQVLLNLVMNARDAMEDRGTLTIRVGTEEVGDLASRFYTDVNPGMYAVISVTDTGRGIGTGLRDKIFEPFYTTDESGEKKGLGLPVVYGIVKQHGGFIDFESEAGEGAVFKVYLPAAVEQVKAERLAKKGIEGGNETILIAEDEDALREIAASILKNLGYQVLATSDGESALALFKERPGEIDMVFLDIAMPGINGLEAYRGMKKIRDDIPVLFVTGYSLDGMHTQFIEEEGLSAIQKPYTLVTLGGKIREVLDKGKKIVPTV